MLKHSSMAGLAAILLGSGAGAAITDPNRTEPYAVLSAEQASLLRLPVRRDYLKNVMDTCGGMYPARAPRYRQAVADWEEPHRAELGKAALLAAGRSYRMHAREMEPLIAAEGAALFAWQEETVGIPAARQPDAQDCDRFAAAIAALD